MYLNMRSGVASICVLVYSYNADKCASRNSMMHPQYEALCVLPVEKGCFPAMTRCVLRLLHGVTLDNDLVCPAIKTWCVPSHGKVRFSSCVCSTMWYFS